MQPIHKIGGLLKSVAVILSVSQMRRTDCAAHEGGMRGFYVNFTCESRFDG